MEVAENSDIGWEDTGKLALALNDPPAGRRGTQLSLAMQQRRESWRWGSRLRVSSVHRGA